MVFELRMQGLCPRTPPHPGALSASIPAGGSPPEDTGTVLTGASVLVLKTVAQTKRPNRSIVQLTGPVSSGGEPLAGGQRKSGQEALFRVRGQSPCICDSKSECAIEENGPRMTVTLPRPCDRKPHPSSHNRGRTSPRTDACDHAA